jgi:hypothetical protein
VTPGLPLALGLGLLFALAPGLPFGLTPGLPFGPHPCNSLCLGREPKARVVTEIHQMDVKTTFFNGELQKEIYMEQPQGFMHQGGEHVMCKLHKSLYGLKQSLRAWN